MISFTPDGGRERYFEYLKIAQPLVARYGAEILFQGMGPVDRLNRGLTEAPNWRARECSRDRSGLMIARARARYFAGDALSSTTLSLHHPAKTA